MVTALLVGRDQQLRSGECRRAERAIISLSGIEPVGDPLLRYMNRLSDLFFAMARRANHERGQADVPWTPTQR